MRRLMLRLWEDDCGALIATEWVFAATILVLGALTGLSLVRTAVVAELSDFANAAAALNQAYSFSGSSNCHASTAGSSFTDFQGDSTASTTTFNSIAPVNAVTTSNAICD